MQFIYLIVSLDGIQILKHRTVSLHHQNSLPAYSNLFKRDKEVTGNSRNCFRESNKAGEKRAETK